MKFIALAFAAVLATAPALHAQIIYADTFDGTNNAALGTTSTGGYSWKSSATSSYIFYYDNAARMAYSQASAPSLAAYVNYSLDDIRDYDISVDLRIPSTASLAPFAILAPRTEATAATDLASLTGAYFFRRSGSDNKITITWWDGSNETTVATSILTVGSGGTGSDNFFTVNIQVRGDAITFVSYGNETLNDTRSLSSSLYNNGTADYLLFGNAPGGTGTASMNFRFDNLTVTQIPEPGTAALFFGALGLLASLAICKSRQG
ncbi:hypothetical protein OPIT5_14480 [Opitutaceae bacterium TAV5]|nr:hypothetical protein OPIT5_14480 [Opitutaceae bacterium TAV5]